MLQLTSDIICKVQIGDDLSERWKEWNGKKKDSEQD